jgi:hypothetical protein
VREEVDVIYSNNTITWWWWRVSTGRTLPVRRRWKKVGKTGGKLKAEEEAAGD